MSNLNRGYVLRRILSILILAAAVVLPATGQTSFQKGEEAFLRNNPKEAAALLEAALLQEPRNEKIYLYLGIVYEQLKNHDKAVSLLKRGLVFAVQYKDLMLFNLGNCYLAKGDNENALRMYDEAIQTNGSLSDAYLNRANVRVKTDKLEPALSDYEIYLSMEPESPKRPQVEKMAELIRNILAQKEIARLEAERKKKEEEEAKRLAEERRKREEEEKRLAEEKRKKEEEERLAREAEEKRLAEEKRRKEEAARQKALLEAVMKSLEASSGEASNLSAEKEDLREKKEEIDIQD